MMILKIIFGVILIFHILASFGRFIMPYNGIYRDIKGDKRGFSSLMFFEIIYILLLLFLAWIIDEQQFIFNFNDAFIWLVGIFLFLCIHLRVVLFIYNIFRKK